LETAFLRGEMCKQHTNQQLSTLDGSYVKIRKYVGRLDRLQEADRST